TNTNGVFTYNLVSVSCGTAGCTSPASGSATVTVNGPTATIIGTGSACLGGNSPIVRINGFNGTAPYTFTYNINGGPNITETTTSGNQLQIPVNTGVLGPQVFNLVSVSSAADPTCEANASGSVTVTIVNIPTAAVTVTGPSTIRPNTTTTLGFTGTPNATVIFNSSLGIHNVTLNAAGTARWTTPSITQTTAFTLLTVRTNPPGCTNNPSAGPATGT